jgi:hypothetical protein
MLDLQLMQHMVDMMQAMAVLDSQGLQDTVPLLYQAA